MSLLPLEVYKRIVRRICTMIDDNKAIVMHSQYSCDEENVLQSPQGHLSFHCNKCKQLLNAF